MNASGGLNLAADPKKDYIQLRVRSREEYQREWNKGKEQQSSAERQISEFGRNRKEWYIYGFCEVCRRSGPFLIDWQYSNLQVPNFRERLVCGRCRLNNRQRYAMKVLQEVASAASRRHPTVYLYEQVTPFYAQARRCLAARVIGSEYLGCDLQSGTEINGLRHEDALHLSFADDSLQVLMSNDVLEHVPDYRRALEEARRVLAPDGKFIFSVPFYRERQETVQRARWENGHLEFLLPEQYHGNPVSADGSLVFFDYGWDLLDACRRAGFKDAYVTVYHSVSHGYLGEGGQLLFFAEK